MNRRDFLRAVSAFTAAAAAGGGAAASASLSTPSAPLVLPEKASRVSCPDGLDLEFVRGEWLEFRLLIQGVGGPLRVSIGGVAATILQNHRESRVILPGDRTALFRPGVKPLQFMVGDEVILAGRAIVKPDKLWQAEEDLLEAVSQMHPLGVISRRDSWEAMFRRRLRADESSRYESEVATLLEHCRPTAAEVFNDYTGCRINFACKGLL